jgi:hypothetical protein
VKVSGAITLTLSDAEPVSYDADGEVSYDITFGNNLISYPFQNGQSIDDALGEAAGNLYAIASEGVAALYSNEAGAWVGSLTGFDGGNGYWLVSNTGFSFSFNGSDDGLTRVAQSELRAVLEVYGYRQSDQHAFFFVNSATINGESLEEEDIVIAYNNDVVVGSRYWNGDGFTDVPAMGVIGEVKDNGTLLRGAEEASSNYCKPGDQISFKVWDESEQKLIDMEVDGDMEWNDMAISVINLIDVFLPTEVNLSNAYPNPFNPVTMLTYDVPSDMNVSMGIYDVRGRLVEELINDMHDQGRYEITWNADQHSSGVYMVKMTAASTVKVQKVMLVK